MSAVIEDGSGVEGANSYASESHVALALEALGYLPSWIAEGGQSLDPYALAATRIIEASHRWPGLALSTAQALGLPREDITLADGRILDGTAKVTLAREACARLAVSLRTRRELPTVKSSPPQVSVHGP